MVAGMKRGDTDAAIRRNDKNIIHIYNHPLLRLGKLKHQRILLNESDLKHAAQRRSRSITAKAIAAETEMIIVLLHRMRMREAMKLQKGHSGITHKFQTPCGYYIENSSGDKYIIAILMDFLQFNFHMLSAARNDSSQTNASFAGAVLRSACLSPRHAPSL